MNEIQNDMTTHLIKAFEKYGVTITNNNIPEVLRLGADTFLKRKGVYLPEKCMTEFYLIIQELR